MRKNLIPKIAEMLGLKLGEKFKLKDDSGIYELNLGGLYRDSVSDQDTFIGLVSGNVEVVKLPWKPKHLERYWTFTQMGKNEQWSVTTRPWFGTPEDISMLKVGWVYHSYKEAQAALPAVTAEYGICRN